MRINAGQMDRRISLKWKVWTGETDEYGGSIYDEGERPNVWCRIQPLKGSETVIAARLTGVQPFVITVPWDPELARMAPSWTAIDEHGGEYDIKSVANMDEKRQFMELLAEKKT